MSLKDFYTNHDILETFAEVRTDRRSFLHKGAVTYEASRQAAAQQLIEDRKPREKKVQRKLTFLALTDRGYCGPTLN